MVLIRIGERYIGHIHVDAAINRLIRLEHCGTKIEASEALRCGPVTAGIVTFELESEG